MDLRRRVLRDTKFRELFELSECIGSGGMGEVYRGTQKLLGRPVAIKFLTEPDHREDFQQRFMAEARMAAGVLHPNVVVLFDSGFASGIPYQVTELVDGQPLSKILESESKLCPRDVISISKQLLAGLAAIHECGIIHRDLKPSNILVSGGERPLVKITDFGIAKQLSSTATQTTTTGVVLGTPLYMSPEQVSGDPLTPASDFYAFALLLFRMIVGGSPYPGAQALEILRAHVFREPEIPDGLHPNIAALISQGLVKTPSLRLADAREMAARLDAVTEQVCTWGSFFEPVPDNGSTTRTPAPGPAGFGARAVHPRSYLPMAMTVLMLAILGLGWWTPAPAALSQVGVDTDKLLQLSRSLAGEKADGGGLSDVFHLLMEYPSTFACHTLADVAANSGAQATDEALLDVIERGLTSPETMPEGEQVGSSRNDGFLCSRNAAIGVSRLVHAILETWPGSGTPVRATPLPPEFYSLCPEFGALHPASALHALYQLIQISRTDDLSVLVSALVGLQAQLVAHPRLALRDWAAELLTDVAGAIGGNSLLGTWGDRLHPDRGPTGGRWPRISEAFRMARVLVRDRWLLPQSRRSTPADLRRALLMAEVFRQATQPRWEADGEIGTVLSTRILHQLVPMKARPAVLALERTLKGSRLALGAPVSRSDLVDLARAMDLAVRPLIDAVATDAARDDDTEKSHDMAHFARFHHGDHHFHPDPGPGL